VVNCFLDNEEVRRKNALWRSRGGQYERHFDLLVGRRNFEAIEGQALRAIRRWRIG